MPPLHPPLMAGFLGLFTIMAIVALVQGVKQRRPFPVVLMLVTTIILGWSTVITASQ